MYTSSISKAVESESNEKSYKSILTKPSNSNSADPHAHNNHNNSHTMRLFIVRDMP